ncbi:Uncharacterised protein [Vibrio cholerae]|nr:Uncharacterised protein [Vibrio cholerae]
MANFSSISLRSELVSLLKSLPKSELLKLIPNWLLDMVSWVVSACTEDANKMLVASKEITVFIKNNL